MRRITGGGSWRVHAAVTVVISAVFAGRAAPAAPAAPHALDDAVLTLPIPARAQAPESPPSGWCGETAIQEGLLHLGMWAPQRAVNRAGRPVHPDLYSPELPVALTALGVRHVAYAGPRGFDVFARWVRTALEAGDPVLAGVKILPTAHPEWGLDHFVLAVGHGPRGLLVNTTWGTRQWVGDTTTPGLSLKNAFYGLRLLGLAAPAGALPARLTLLEEGEATVKLRVTCAGTKRGARYRVERRSGPASATTSGPAPWSEDVTAEGDRIAKELTVESERVARFHCVPL